MRRVRRIPIILATFILIGACKSGYEPINYGKEACAHCKMTILDKRYAAEMVTKKGRVYKFDDLLCMKKFSTENDISPEIGDLYVANFIGDSNSMLNLKQAVIVHNNFFQTPMNGNCAAFEKPADAKYLIDSLHAQTITWDKIGY